MAAAATAVAAENIHELRVSGSDSYALLIWLVTITAGGSSV